MKERAIVMLALGWAVAAGCVTGCVTKRAELRYGDAMRRLGQLEGLVECEQSSGDELLMAGRRDVRILREASRGKK